VKSRRLPYLAFAFLVALFGWLALQPAGPGVDLAEAQYAPLPTPNMPHGMTGTQFRQILDEALGQYGGDYPITPDLGPGTLMFTVPMASVTATPADGLFIGKVGGYWVPTTPPGAGSGGAPGGSDGDLQKGVAGAFVGEGIGAGLQDSNPSGPGMISVTPLDQVPAPNNAVDMNGQRLSNLGIDIGTGDAMVSAESTLASLNTFAASVITGTPFTITNLSRYQSYSDSCAFGSRIVTLPSATGSGTWIRLVKNDTTSNTLTITAAGSDTINGAATLPLNTYTAVELHDDAVGQWGTMVPTAGGAGSTFPLVSDVSAAGHGITDLRQAVATGEPMTWGALNQQFAHNQPGAKIVSSSGATSGSGGVTISAPASISPGNALVAFVFTVGSAAPTFGSLPSGFTQIGTTAASTASHGLAAAVFCKTATGSEPGTYTFTWTPLNFQAGLMYQVAGISCSQVDGAVESGNASNASSQTVAVPGIATTHENDFIMTAAGVYGAGTMTVNGSSGPGTPIGDGHCTNAYSFDQPSGTSPTINYSCANVSADAALAVGVAFIQPTVITSPPVQQASGGNVVQDLQGSINGAINLAYPPAYLNLPGAVGDGATCNEAILQNLLDAIGNLPYINSNAGIVRPKTFLPYGDYELCHWGLVIDPPAYQANMHYEGDGQYVSLLHAQGNFPVLQVMSPTILNQLGAITTTSLLSGSGAAMNWAVTGSSGASSGGEYYYDLHSALYKHFGAAPLNNLPAFEFSGAFTTPISSSSTVRYITVSQGLGSGAHSNRSLILQYQNTTMEMVVHTGALGAGTQTTAACPAFAANTTTDYVFDYDGSYLVCYLGTPGATSAHGTPVAMTGVVTQAGDEIWQYGGFLSGIVGIGQNEGANDAFEIENVANHSCPSGVCTNFTMETAKPTPDAHTMLLLDGTDSTGTYTFSHNAMPVTYSGGATDDTWMPLLTVNANNQSYPLFLKNVMLAGGNAGLLSQLVPGSYYEHLYIANGNWLGMGLENNSYNDHCDNIDIYNAGAYRGYWENNQSFCFITGLKVTFGGALQYFGGGFVQASEFDPASDTIHMFELHNNNGAFNNVAMSFEDDSENGYAHEAIYVDSGGVYTLSGATLVSNSGVPMVQFASGGNNVKFSFVGVNFEGSGGGVTPIDLQTPGSNEQVSVLGSDINDSGVYTPDALCGTTNSRYCDSPDSGVAASVNFADLATYAPAAGTTRWCRDCTEVAGTCSAGSGNGDQIVRLANSTWRCP
jgi:hypothetical protein